MFLTRKGIVIGAEPSDSGKGLTVPWHSFQKWNRQLKGMSGAKLNYEKNGETLEITQPEDGMIKLSASLGDDRKDPQVFNFVVPKDEKEEGAPETKPSVAGKPSGKTEKGKPTGKK